MIRETEKLEGSFAEPSVVAAVEADLESWSALVFRHLEASPVRGGDPRTPVGQ
jgi:hypothetical protein